MTADETLQTVVIRFAGDSGDGMQLTGARFTEDAALYGNDIRTLPDFPAEIRAPAGTLAGVSSFQLSFADHALFTPGDAVDVLVAMNPAALKSNVAQVRPGGHVIVNTSQFSKRNLEKAGFTTNPLEDAGLAANGDGSATASGLGNAGILSGLQVHPVDISKLTETALEDLGLPPRTVERCKNFFALGLVFWLYHRKLEHTEAWIGAKFAGKETIAEANRRALRAGYNFGETAEIFPARYKVAPSKAKPGTYTNITGNKALVLGLIAASQRSSLELFLGSYPITPASDILHEMSRHKAYGVHTFQAEDEIAGVTAAIGAAYGGALAVTTTSGPGLALKAEAMGLAHMTELPLVVVDVQRAGPSTGMPTKTEQSDLLQAMFGRNGDAPVPVLAAATPADCFETAYEAARIAVKYMTPVVILSDGYIANGSEPWLLPQLSDLPAFDEQLQAVSPTADAVEQPFEPYARNEKTLARPWAVPGTAGLEHRIGGLEKEDRTGSVSYDPENHERMVQLRAEKVQRVATQLPATQMVGPDSGDVLVIGWGSTKGAIEGGVRRLQKDGFSVSAVHLRYVHPLPSDLAQICSRFRTVVVPEMNTGQLAWVLRAALLVDAKSHCKVQGLPFREQEIYDCVSQLAQASAAA